MAAIGPLDVAWLFVETDSTPMHVGCLQIFSPPAQADSRYITEQAEKLLRHRRCAPPFSLRMRKRGLALPEWEELDNVDLEYHVQQWALPSPGSVRELHELVADLHGQAMDMHRPLWECHVIEGLDDGRFALFIKIHHSLMDGVGGMRILNSLLSHDSSRTDLSPPWSPSNALARHAVLEATPAKQTLVQRMGKLIDQFKALPDASESLAKLAWAGMHHSHSDLQAPYIAPRCILNQRVSHQRAFSRASLPMRNIRALAKHAGVSINDVLLCLCGGALRRYLQDQNALPEDPLIAGLPMSVRGEDDAHIGTAVSFIIASLATHLEDPRERLYAVHASTQAGKTHINSLSPDALTEYTLLMMAPFMGELLTGLAGRVTPAFNVIISNVPGPKETLFFNGAQLEAMYPLSIVTHGQALNITLLSYGDQLHFGLSACKQLVPQLDTLARYISQEMEALTQLLDPPEK